MEITYCGHSCFLLKIGDSSVIFDPFITPNPLARGLDVNAIHVDFILLSHGHADHVADVETIYGNSPNATVVGGYEVATWFANKGLERHLPMNHGGTVELPFGRVKMTNAVHSSSMPDGSNGGHPGGFVVQTAEKTFYYAGDTALTYDMKLIGEEFDIDFAFLPMGDHFTMDIKDALKAAQFVGTKKVIAMHYDTFPPIKVDKDACVKMAAAAGIELIFSTIAAPFEP